MLYSALLLFLSFLIVFLPQFALPVDYYRTITMAYEKADLRWWTHPELYLGALLFIFSIVMFVKRGVARKRLMALSAVIGLLTAIQGWVLLSFSVWMFWLPEEKREYHKQVLALYRGITPLLIVLGLSVFIVAVLGYIHYSRYPEGRRVRLSVYTLAGANLFRKPFRTVAVILVSALAACITFFGSYVLVTTLLSGGLSLTRIGADIIVVPKGYEVKTRSVILGGEPVEFTMPAAVLDKVLSVKGVAAASPQLYMRTLPYRGCCTIMDMLIVAIDPKTDFTVKPWIEFAIKDGLGPYEVIVGRHVMFAPGQRIQFFDRYMKVVGTLDGTGLNFFDTSGFVSLDYAHEMASRFPDADNRALSGSISTVLVKIAPGYDVDEVSGRLKGAVPGVEVIAVKSMLPPTKLWLLESIESLWPLLALVWVFCFAVLLVVFLMMFNERLKEVGLMRALGARRNQLLRLFVSEAALLVGIGSMAGIACGWLLTALYRSSLEISTGRYHWPGLGQTGLLALGCVLLGLLVGLGSAFFPAFRVSSTEPYSAIRKGE